MQVAAAQARFLSPKQRFDVWLELATPEAHGQGGDELFQVRLLVFKGQVCNTSVHRCPLRACQVSGELLSADGRVAGASSRPCLVRQRYWLTRNVR